MIHYYYLNSVSTYFRLRSATPFPAHLSLRLISLSRLFVYSLCVHIEPNEIKNVTETSTRRLSNGAFFYSEPAIWSMRGSLSLSAHNFLNDLVKWAVRAATTKTHFNNSNNDIFMIDFEVLITFFRISISCMWMEPVKAENACTRKLKRKVDFVR